MGLFDSIADAFGTSTDKIAGGVGGLFGAGMDFLGQSQANNANVALMNQGNAFNAAQSKAQMDFQERMRATQYQTAVEDLKKAGLSPMLAYTQGGSGNLAGSSASSISAPPQANKLSGLVNAATKGAQYMETIDQQKLQNALTTAQITDTEKAAQNKDAQTALAVEQIPVSQAIVKEKDATVRSLLNGIRLQNSSIGLNAARAAHISQDINIRDPEEWAAKKYGKPKQVAKDVGATANSALDAFSKIKGRGVTINNPTYNRTQYLDRD